MVGLALVLLAATPPVEAVPHPIAPAVVHIHSSNGYGSGFFVRRDGLILTNAHVVKGDDTVEVELFDGLRLRGTVLERATGAVDLALVKVDAQTESVLPLTGYADADAGSWVAAIGYGEDGSWDYQVGSVTKVFPKNSLKPVVESTIRLGEGSSGTPLVDNQGRVVGIVTAARCDFEQDIFSIRADVALQSLRNLTGLCDCLVVTAPKDVRIYVDGQRAGKGPWVAIPAEPRQYEVYAVVDGRLRRAKIDYPERREVDLSAAGF